MSGVSGNTWSDADVLDVWDRIDKWQQKQPEVFVMSDGVPKSVKDLLGEKPFSLACKVQPRQQNRADGPEMVFDLTPTKSGAAPFTISAAQANNYVRDSDSPMYPVLV